MNKKLNLKFYQHLAKLFYAMAAVDKFVHPNEIKVLKEIVRDAWLDVDDSEDAFKTDAAYQIEIVFDWLLEQELDAKRCFDDFVTYKNEHNYFFSKAINSLILKTAGAITTAFSRQKKSELILLSKLSVELNKTV